MTLIDLTAPPATSARLDALPVAIIGAGPIGLAAAAHLVERGRDVVILEAGDSVASSVRDWGHIRLFSPWSELIDPAARRLLEASGWSAPASDVAPYGIDLVTQYLEPLASLPAIASRVRLSTAVDAVTREGMDRTRTAGRATTPFALRVRGADGVSELLAGAVIDASGTYRTSNSLGSNGLDPLGFAEVADRVTPAMPNVLGAERERFAGKHVLVVGAGHSAANTLINLASLIRDEPSTTVTWAIRNASAARITASDSDGLPGRASLGSRVATYVDRGLIDLVTGFEIVALSDLNGRVDVTGLRNGELEHITADVVVRATGFRPNLDILREVRLDLDEIVEAPRRLAPLIDPNVHTCGTVEPHGFAELRQPEPNFFLAGMKSYGRAPTFLLATGHEQVRSIAAYLTGDLGVASEVRIELPATGVCSTVAADGTGCC